MPTYEFEIGPPETLPDDMPPEQQRIRVREIAQQRLRNQVRAGEARAAVRTEQGTPSMIDPNLLEAARREDVERVEPPFSRETRHQPSFMEKILGHGPRDLSALATPEGRKLLVEDIVENIPGLVAGVLGGIGGARAASSVGSRVTQATRPAFGKLAGLLTRVGVPVAASSAGEAAGAAGGQVLREGEVTPERMIAGAERGLLPGVLGVMGGEASVRTRGPFARSVTPEGREAQAVLTPRGARLTPAMMTENRFLDLLENVGTYAITGGKRIPQQRAMTEEIADQALREVRLKYPERGGSLVGQLYEKARNTPTNQGVPLRSALVETRTIQTEADTVLAELLDYHPQARKIERWIKQLDPERTTFEQLDNLKSALLEEGRKPISPGVSHKAQGAAKHLALELDTVLEGAAKNAGPGAYENWRLASHTFRKSLFGEYVDEVITGSQPKGKAMRRGGLGLVDGELVLSKLNRLSPQEAKGFDPGDLENLRKFARVLATAQAKDPEGTMKVWVQLVQGGVAGGIVAGGASVGMAPEAVGLIMAPRVISWAVTNPVTARWLTESFKRPGSRESARALGLLAGQLMGRQMQEPPQQRERGRPLPWEMTSPGQSEPQP